MILLMFVLLIGWCLRFLNVKILVMCDVLMMLLFCVSVCNVLLGWMELLVMCLVSRCLRNGLVFSVVVSILNVFFGVLLEIFGGGIWLMILVNRGLRLDCGFLRFLFV